MSKFSFNEALCRLKPLLQEGCLKKKKFFFALESFSSSLNIMLKFVSTLITRENLINFAQSVFHQQQKKFIKVKNLT